MCDFWWIYQWIDGKTFVKMGDVADQELFSIEKIIRFKQLQSLNI